MLVGPSKCLKEIIHIEFNRAKESQLAGGKLTGYKLGRGFEVGTTVNIFSQWSGWDLSPRPSNCKASALTTRPMKKHYHFLMSTYPLAARVSIPGAVGPSFTTSGATYTNAGPSEDGKGANVSWDLKQGGQIITYRHSTLQRVWT